MNKILELLGNNDTNIDTSGLLNMISNSRTNLQDSLHGVLQGTTQDTLEANPRAKLPTRNTNTPVDTKTSSESILSNDKLQNYIDKNKDLQYSQNKRYKDGYGDCSTFACKLQKEVYGKDVPDTTLGMLSGGSRVSTPRVGDIAIYDTGRGNRHAVTYLGDGMGVQLGNDGVKVKPMNTWKNLIGNYRF